LNVWVVVITEVEKCRYVLSVIRNYEVEEW
jgi:hypothetical protein